MTGRNQSQRAGTMTVHYVSVLLDNDVLQSENEHYYIIRGAAVKLLRQLFEAQCHSQSGQC